MNGNRPSQKFRFEVVGKHQTVNKVEQLCCFCQTETRTICLSEKFDNNFRHLKERLTANDLDEDKYSGNVGKLSNAFQSRFSEFADQPDH